MSPPKSVMSMSGPLSSSGIMGAGKKGRPPKLVEPTSTKRRQAVVRKEAVEMSISSIRRRGNGRRTLKRKRQPKAPSSKTDSDDSDDDTPAEADLEEVYEVTYVEDFIDTVDLVDDLARQNSLMLEAHCEQIGWLEKIESEMSKLVGDGNSNDNDFEPGRLNSEKKEVLRNLEDLLIQSSRTGDSGVRICDEIDSIVQDKLRTLNIDYNNLTTERAKWDSNTPSVSHRTGKAKKPSINPTPHLRRTPTSPAPSSSSSVDNKSGKDSQPPETLLDDSRYRSCKFRNPPTYVFNSRLSSTTTGSNTPKKSDQNSQNKSSQDERNEKDNANAPKKTLTRTTSSQGSSKKPGSGGTDSAEDSSDGSSSSDSEKSPKPTYCLCEKVSFGKMIMCDNELCPIEWFHFKCVNVKKKPYGKWYCPRCRGESAAVMKPKSEFIKELEEYNKQKEKEN